MALTQTLAQLRTRVRQRADIETDSHVADSELTGLVNDAIRYVHDLLVNEGPEDYYNTTQTFTTTGASSYALTSSGIITANDFYKLRALYVNEGNNQLRIIHPVQEDMRQLFRPATATVDMVMEYIPLPTALSSDSDTYDGINGWEELVVIMAAIDVKMKREESPGYLTAKRRDWEERIRRMASRDLGHPRRVARNKTSMKQGWIYPGQGKIDGYRIRAGNLELFRLDGLILRPA